MADTQGYGFRQPMALHGPYPSGAPAIFIDQVARLGHNCALISAVGNDDFGRLNTARLQNDGVDISAVHVIPDLATGSAFVRYRPDGERDFVYNIQGAACSRTALTRAAEAIIDDTAHFHVMGSSLFSFRLIDDVVKAVHRVKEAGGRISFDPNLRKEMLDIPEMRAAMDIMLQACDVFLPSGPELLMLTEAKTEDAAIEELLALGISEIVIKRGAHGASVVTANSRHTCAPLSVCEIDPTGAGDCFGATYVTLRLEGEAPETALRYANASGARAVSARGPMEGVSTRAELDACLSTAAEVWS